ncbi:hypothetical protein [Oceanobacillus halophilus]|uniref:Zinc ribbon domain-containing protein n=1 Tax=Oceanobacillus halophilus TaxID=930130 RepID=A0A494ZRZ2_9BACI|nr:hypothetical protein [Oceanobacillus halophilus]RKQ28564.1 hypothetical protein D8M06_18800 [Oceanobacillus halophilus]
MLQCTSCQHQQDSGKFCEVCGSSLQKVENQGAQQAPSEIHENSQAAATTAPSQQTTDNVKNALGNYGSYILDLLKNPTKALHLNETFFANGLINMGIYVVGLALGFYFLIQSIFEQIMLQMDSMLGEFTQIITTFLFSFIGIDTALFDQQFGKIPFLDTVFPFFLTGLFFLGLGYVTMLVAVKVAKASVSWKELIAQYGGLLAPFVVLSVLSIVTGLSGSITFTISIALINFIFCTILLPALLVFENIKNATNQRVYISLATSAVALLVTYIFVENQLSKIINYIEMMF